jgi:hypothetical protein
MYTTGLGRTTMSRYVNLSTFCLAAGAYIFYFYLFIVSNSEIILNRDGRYRLYLDDTLLDGSSARCSTFENEPLCSAGTRKGENVVFECVGLEVWAVGPT